MHRSSGRVPSLIALVAVVLVACSSAAPTQSMSPGTSLATGANAPTAATPASAAPQNPAAQALSGWIVHFTNGVRFIQWVDSAGALTGTSSWVLTPIGVPTKLQQGSDAFTGVVSGGSVTLTFQEGLGQVQTWVGTLSGQTLTLSFTTSDGTMEVDTYQPGTVTDYNTAVSQVKAQVQQVENAGAQASAAAAAAAQQQQQLAAEQANIDSGSRAVANDLASLPNDVQSMQRDLDIVPNDLATMQNDVGQTYKDLEAVIAEANTADSGTVCGDAGGVASDAGGVASDEGGIEGDGSGLTGDYNGIGSDVQGLQQDFANLQSAEAALPSYGSGLPSANDVGQAIKAANAAVATAQETFAGYLAKAKQMVQTANGYASQAQSVCSQLGG